jgi:hypothetical protein
MKDPRLFGALRAPRGQIPCLLRTLLWGSDLYSVIAMESLGGVLQAAPTAISWANNRIDVFAAGPGNTPWHWSWDGMVWLAPAPLPGGAQAQISAVGIAAISLGTNQMDVFAAGQGNTPWWWHWDGKVWVLPRQLFPIGANLPAEAIAVTSSGPNIFDVFAAGQGNTPWWWHWQAGSMPGAPQQLPIGANLPAERIAAISPSPGRLDVFAAGGQNHLWHWQGPSWAKPVDLGGNLPAEGLSVVSSSTTQMDVFAAQRVGGANNPLQHWSWDGQQFTAPESVPGNLTAYAVSSVTRGGQIDVFGVSGDTNLTRWQLKGLHWVGPTALGGSLPAGDVSAVSPFAGRIDVFARGTDNTLQHWSEIKIPPPPPVDTSGHLTFVKVSDGVQGGINFAQFGLLNDVGVKPPPPPPKEMVFEFGPSSGGPDWIIHAAELAMLREALVRKLVVTVTHNPASNLPLVVKVMAPP